MPLEKNTIMARKMKIVYLVLVFFVIFSSILLCSCSSQSHDLSKASNRWTNDAEKLKVLSTTSMIDDIVAQIGKDRIQAITLITGQLDPHSYQLVKGDDEKLAAADLIFFNGLELEHGPSLQRYLTTRSKAVSLGDLIRRQSPEIILIHQGEIDPHIWMDVSIWIRAVDIVSEELSKADPVHQAEYHSNSEKLKERMRAVDGEIRSLALTIPEEKRYLVTSHDAFNYFARAYLATSEEKLSGNWRRRVAAPEGLAPEGQLSSKDIQDIIDYLKRNGIRVLFSESNISQDSIKKIIDAGSKEGVVFSMAKTPLYSDAMGPPGSSGDTYIKMMKHNMLTIANELNSPRN